MKLMLEKYAKRIWHRESVNVLLAINSGGNWRHAGKTCPCPASPNFPESTESGIHQTGCKILEPPSQRQKQRAGDLNSVIQSHNYGGGFLTMWQDVGKKYTAERQRKLRKGTNQRKSHLHQPCCGREKRGWRCLLRDVLMSSCIAQTRDQSTV